MTLLDGPWVAETAATGLGARLGLPASVRPLWHVGPAGGTAPYPILVVPQGKGDAGAADTAEVAQLVAAAPQLRAVLEALVCEAEMSRRRDGRTLVHPATLAQAAAVLRHARGESD